MAHCRHASGVRALALLGLVPVGILLAASPAEPQSRVEGTVLDGESGTPVVGAMVTIQARRPLLAETDQDGNFILSGMDHGPHEITIRHLAYRPVERSIEVAGEGRVTRLMVELNRDTVALAPIVVTVDRRPTMGRLGEVYDRMELMRSLGQGRFWGREELEMSGVTRVSDLLRMLPGTSVIRDDVRISPDPGCMNRHVTYLDGARFPLADTSLDGLAAVADLEAVEVYRRANEVPGEFGGSDARCGVIALWTRRGL